MSDESVPMNEWGVGVAAHRTLLIFRPPRQLTYDQATSLAAWLVALTDREDEFKRKLCAIEST
jgi:hypothetical protein